MPCEMERMHMPCTQCQTVTSYLKFIRQLIFTQTYSQNNGLLMLGKECCQELPSPSPSAGSFMAQILPIPSSAILLVKRTGSIFNKSSQCPLPYLQTNQMVNPEKTEMCKYAENQSLLFCLNKRLKRICSLV